MLKDLQLFEQHEAGRVWRRFEHRETAVVNADGILLIGLEGVEIGRRNQTSGSLQTGRQPPPQATVVEGSRAVRGDLFERSGEVRLDDRSAEGRRLTAGEKSCGAARVRHQSRPVFVCEKAVGPGGAN